ncbi:MAG: NAD-dependent dehydratase [Sphingobacteriales bacterium]|nr:MAG: NAD-dependent dehydratase [Sphingobacteriales bacterium]
MKYVITGSLGHISKPVVQALVNAQHSVTVITSSKERAAAIEALGAKAAIGSVEDAAFVTQAFDGANAVYLMIPPNFAVTNWRTYQDAITANYVQAVIKNNIQYVVILSSIGAHMGNGAGPVDGVAALEKEVATVPNIHVKVLRPSYFFYNLFTMIPLVRNMGFMGANFGNTNEKLVLTDTDDIAAAATEALLHLSFKEFTIQYIASDERHPNEIAAVLGSAINKPAVNWVSFTDEQSLQGMLQAGLPQTIAEGYTTMGTALRSGQMQADYWNNRPQQLGKLKLEAFAAQFAAVYNAS